MKQALTQLLKQRHGALTRDLVLEPGRFGLGMVPSRLTPDRAVQTVCGYCSTGCNLTVHLQGDRATNITPTRDYPVNRGVACPKGWEALTPMAAPDRATVPLLRDSSGRKKPVTWDKAFGVFTERMKAVQREYGRSAVAFLGTGQITTEEIAFLGTLARVGMGIEHGDGNTRQCMATAAFAYKESFGFDAPPYTYDDLEQSDVLVFVGANPCIAHPILWQRVCRNKRNPEIIVVDPRATETAMAATQHLAVRPKSDLTLLYALARALIETGAVDEQYVHRHTRGYDEFAQFVAPYTIERACDCTGLHRTDIERLVETIARGERVSFWWTMGVNQSHQGVRTAQAIINLALMTGNVGRPGTGANSITGQCNAMGSRLFSNTTSLPGGRDFASASDRVSVARVLEVDPSQIPDTPSFSYDKILEAVLSGEIRALWVIGTNGAHSWINGRDFQQIASKLEFLVVQDIYADTETAKLADLVLPAAGWGEKRGTFINSERRLSVVNKVRKAPGQALADFAIFQGIARYWGCDQLADQWASPDRAFQIMKELSRDTPCDFSGIEDLAMIERSGGIQWPQPTPAVSCGQQRRLFEDGQFFTADQRARFVFDEPRPVPEPTTARYPLTLLTGRGSSSQWHTQTRTGRSPILSRLAPEAVYVEINPHDARERGIGPSDEVVVRSRRGRVVARAVVCRTVPPACVFIPMHYVEANKLTFPAFDPHSRQPAYKACAVQLESRQSWEG